VLSRIYVRRILFAIAAILASALAGIGVEIALVPTPSMEGTILVGDHLLVDKLLYGPFLWHERLKLPALLTPKRNDVVSFRAPGSRDVYVKRVIGVGGDSIEVRARRFFVNGEYVGTGLSATPRAFDALVTIPAGMFFVMGDNRDESEDSRQFGLVPAASVIGEPVMVCWSIAMPQRDWLNDHGSIRAAAYLTWVTHLATRTRWNRFAKPL
jgi:signal peptidase I